MDDDENDDVIATYLVPRSAVSCTKLKSKSNESNLTKRSEEGGFDYSASSTSR